jgi:hypothetical protein
MIDSYCHGHGNASNESNTSVTTLEWACQKNAATLADVRGPKNSNAIWSSVQEAESTPSPLPAGIFAPSLGWAAVSKLAISAHDLSVLRQVHATHSSCWCGKQHRRPTVASRSPATCLCSALLGVVKAILIRLTHSAPTMTSSFG